MFRHRGRVDTGYGFGPLFGAAIALSANPACKIAGLADYLTMIILLLILGLIFLLPLTTPEAGAQALNLRGGIDVNYGHNRVDTISGQSQSWSFLHRYNLGSYGTVWHPRLGSYDLDVAYQEDTGKTQGVRNRDLDTMDYRAGLNLFPRKMPLTFFAQRIRRESELQPSPSRNMLNTYSLTGDLLFIRKPLFRINLFQADSENISDTSSTSSRIRTASIDATQRFETTSLFARYQYSIQENSNRTDTRAHNVNFNAETRINPNLVFNAHGNYSNRSTTLGVLNPQIGSFQQRSAGASLIHQPRLGVTNRVNYDFFKDPFERHIFQGTSNYRANEKLDLFGSYRFLRFGLQSALTQSHLAAFGTNYRPILGVSSGLNVSYNLTDVNAASDTTVFSQSYNWFVNYFKTLERILLNAGYSGNYIRTDPDPGGVTNDFINTLTVGVNNANPRYASLGASYAYSNTYRFQNPGPDTSLDQHTFNLTAQSNYLRNLWLRGDILSITASVNYIIFEVESGTETSLRSSETVVYDTLRGIIFTAGHNYENVGIEFNERNLLFGQVQWITLLLQDLYLTASGRETYEMYTNRDNILLFEGRLNLIYHLGRITMSLDYTYTHQDETLTDFTSQSVFVRASRPLF